MDIAIIKYPAKAGDPVSFGFRSGKGTADGIRSLVAIVIHHLLTRPGTHAVNENMGTGLLGSLARAGNNVDKVATATQIALQKAHEDILRSQEEETLPADVRLANISVSSLRVEEGKVFLGLTVTNEVGESAEVVL